MTSWDPVVLTYVVVVPLAIVTLVSVFAGVYFQSKSDRLERKLKQAYEDGGLAPLKRRVEHGAE